MAAGRGSVPAGVWASLEPVMRRTLSCASHGPVALRVPLTMSFTEYVHTVLNENFEDAKALFLEPLLAIHGAHLVMLAEQDIVTRPAARTQRRPHRGVPRHGPPHAVRRLLRGSVLLRRAPHRRARRRRGRAAAHRPQPQRHRHDDVRAPARLRPRPVRRHAGAAHHAGRHRRGPPRDGVPGHTHTQRAQPTTLAHYLLGVIEQLERDGGRLRAAFATTNRSPLGACAITGTAFPIDRDRTSALLGFDGPTGNTYGSIATVDYLLESLSAASVALVGIGRVVQDLLLWCTAEFRYLRLGDGFVQVSSIMPQKRNPVALEHARSVGSKALGQATAVMLSVHNTPFGDIVDTEDDLQPLVQQTFRDAVRAVSLVAASLRTATFDAAEMFPPRRGGVHHRHRAGRLR